MRRWLGICALLIFGAGMVTGILIRDAGPFGGGEFTGSEGRGTPVAGGAPKSPELAANPPLGDSVGSILDPDLDYPLYLVTSALVYETLKLSPEQHRQLGELCSTHLRRLREIRSGMTLLAGELRAGIVSLLDDEQRVAFEGIQKEYSDHKVERYVDRKIASLRRAVQLSLDQEAAVYGIFFDTVSKKKEIWRKQSHLGVDECRERSRAVCVERDTALGEVLRPDQFAAYQEQRDRERQLQERGRERVRQEAECSESKDGQAGVPTPPST